MIAVADHLSAAKPTSLHTKIISDLHVGSLIIIYAMELNLKVRVLLQRGGQIRRYYDCLDHRKNPHRLI